MNKNLTAIFLSFLLLAGCADISQRLEVKATHKGSSSAKVTLFEGDAKIASFDALVGRSGIAKEGKKREGDGKTPSGKYPVTALFGTVRQNPSMPFIKTDKNLICIDDSNSPDYNKVADKRDLGIMPNSFEDMLREDGQYEYGAVIGYNEKREPQMGSCIFIHIKSDKNTPTAGCVALQRDDLFSLLNKLELSKNPSIEIVED